jgi:hypothetical protein|eukprot:COSAG06_NODE_6806_length_2769_cov_8.485768_3_plen_119_part_00
MKQQTASAGKDKVLCGDFELTNVYSLCYLGHLFQGDGDHSHDIETLLARASQVFGDLRTIFEHPDLGQGLKVGLFRSAVCSVLAYGNEVCRGVGVPKWRCISVARTRKSSQARQGHQT